MSATKVIIAKAELPMGVSIATQYRCDVAPFELVTDLLGARKTAESNLAVTIKLDVPEGQAAATARALISLAEDIQRAHAAQPEGTGT